MSSEKILTLTYHLRYQGVNVSIRSTVMASKIWNRYKDEFTLKELKEALRCVYVKNKEDIIRYERSFDYVFLYNRNTKNNPADQEHIEVKKQLKPSKIDKSKPAQDTTRETIIRRRLQHKKVVTKSILDDELTRLNTIDYRVFDICNDFSKKIANKRSVRQKKNKSHIVDIPRTIRKNLKVGGHLINLVTKKPPMHKSKHIFLCDISISCEWATTWFFSLLTGCHKSFDKITVEAFDHRIIDVTHALDVKYKNSFQVNVGLQSLGLRPRGHSDMTKAFTEFLHKTELDRHTDVILLTDCRDWTGQRKNGILESATILHQIVVKSRNVYIFNPEHKIRWNTPTSCVRDYQEAGAKVFQTNTLKEFAKVIKEI